MSLVPTEDLGTVGKRVCVCVCVCVCERLELEDREIMFFLIIF